MKKYFYDPIFRAPLCFIYDCDFDSYKKVVKKIIGKEYFNINFGEDSPGQCFYTNIEGKVGLFYFIYVKKDDDKFTLVHEVNHIVNFILSDRGIFLDDPKSNNETHAYYMEYWYSELTSEMEKNVRNKFKKAVENEDGEKIDG